MLKMDLPSFRGRFGWHAFESRNIALPYLMRLDGSRLVAKRMVDDALNLQDLGPLVKTWKEVVRFEEIDPSPRETWLLNTINFQHCDGHFGHQLFDRCDRLVKLDDAEEVFRLFQMIHDLLTGPGGSPDGDRFYSSSPLVLRSI